MIAQGAQQVLALSTAEGVGVFVGIPLAIVAVVSALVMLPSMMRGPRYRPGRAYEAQALWFGGPEDAENAVAAARPTGATGGSRGRW